MNKPEKILPSDFIIFGTTERKVKMVKQIIDLVCVRHRVVREGPAHTFEYYLEIERSIENFKFVYKIFADPAIEQKFQIIITKKGRIFLKIFGQYQLSRKRIKVICDWYIPGTWENIIRKAVIPKE